MKHTFTTKSLIIFLFSIIFFSTSFAQDHTIKAIKNTVKDSYNFWVYTPEDYSTSKGKTPLIIFLHGASLKGNNLDKVLKYGPLHAINMGRKINSIILAPQNPSGSWQAKKVDNMLEWAKTNYDFDTNRIYVIGMSLGCYGTLDYIGAYPNKVAAAMAICGGTSLKDVQVLGETPLWIIHGTADKTIPISTSKKIVQSLINKNNDNRLLYTWLNGYNHFNIAKILYISKTYNWLFTHNLNDTHRAVSKNFAITDKDLRNAYNDLSNSSKKPTIIR